MRLGLEVLTGPGGVLRLLMALVALVTPVRAWEHPQVPFQAWFAGSGHLCSPLWAWTSLFVLGRISGRSCQVLGCETSPDRLQFPLSLWALGTESQPLQAAVPPRLWALMALNQPFVAALHWVLEFLVDLEGASATPVLCCGREMCVLSRCASVGKVLILYCADAPGTEGKQLIH